MHVSGSGAPSGCHAVQPGQPGADTMHMLLSLAESPHCVLVVAHLAAQLGQQ